MKMKTAKIKTTYSVVMYRSGQSLCCPSVVFWTDQGRGLWNDMTR